MDKQLIPINLLDKVKYELNQRDRFQYFFTYYIIDGRPDSNRLEEAVHEVYNANHKLNQRLIWSGGRYKYWAYDFKLVFHVMEASDEEVDNPAVWLENRATNCIQSSEEAPLIVQLIRSENRALLILLHNHIYYDGSSAYALFNQLIGFYNGDRPEKLITIYDRKVLKDKIPKGDSFSVVRKCFFVANHLMKSIYYLSSLNAVRKIYKHNSFDKVCYRSLTLPLQSKSDVYSSNSAICAAIAKAFLAIKGELTDQAVSIAIPANFRNANQQSLLGNLVYSISVKLENADINAMAQVVNRKTALFKNRYREWAAYQLFYKLTDRKSKKDLIKTFAKISNKHHFYVTNLGDFRKKYSCFFKECGLRSAGGFNFPIQENYGLIFTIVPHGEAFSLGLAFAERLFTDKEFERFKSELITAYQQLESN